MKIDELLEGITPEHNIPDDFVEAVRTSYAESVEALTAEIATANDAAIAALKDAHTSEIERIRAEKFETILDPEEPVIDSVGNNSIDELTIDNYWEEEK